MNRVKKQGIYGLALIATLLIAASCASKPPAPEPEPTPPATTPVVVEKPAPKPDAPSISQEELDKLLAEAQALKKKAFDLKLFEVLPDDYKSADALLQKGRAAYDAKDAEAAKSGLETAITAYKKLLADGVVALAASKQKKAEDMKQTAVDAGADASAMERFGPANEAYYAGVDQVEAAQHEKAIALFDSARLYFELAYKRAKASGLRDAISEKGYAAFDAGNFQTAEAKYEAEEGLWAAGTEVDRTAGVAALDEAIQRYGLVLQKGREGTAFAGKEKSDRSKARSEEMKAQVAVKDLYGAAKLQQDEAAAKMAAGDYEDALELFEAAAEGFDAAYTSAADKRAKAETAMKAAAEAEVESGRVAEDGDALILQAANP
ncbi:MAG: hypothetical protein Q8M76_17660 [Spirochaetaceae bacterium]|nr:hypothetical protein [Spirochaetaceae bacterium]